MIRLFILLLCGLFSANIAAQSRFYTGLWEYTIDIQSIGMPRSELKKVQDCIKELNDVINVFKPAPACEVNDVQVTKNQLSWQLNCKTRGETHRGVVKLEGDMRKIQGRMDMQTSVAGLKNVVRTTYYISGLAKGSCQ